MKKWICMILFAGMAAVLCTGCGERNAEEQQGEQGGKVTETAEATVKGMYLTYGEKEDEQYIFVDTENQTLFYAEIPDDAVYDEMGEKISEEDLEKGDTIAIYGNGIVLESYPAQYAGITKMVRVKKGNPADAEQYEGLIAEIYQEPDPKEVPYLSVENEQKIGLVTTAVNQGTLHWSYVDENGETQMIETSAKHVLEWMRSDAELVEVTCDTNDKDLQLIFTKAPKSVKVTRWDGTADVSMADKGEEIVVELDGKEAELDHAKPDSIYEVVAEWENGTVTYGFAVK